MPYMQKVVNCGNVLFVKKYFATRHNKKGQIIRRANENKTSAAQETVNDRNKIERFAILANSNFSEGDYFVTFTYKRENRPASVDEARKQWNKVLRRLRTAYKKQGAEFKYLWCLEHKKYAYHFHLLCNNEINSKCFAAAWDFGKVNTETLDNREYHTLGEYMMKEQYIKDEGNTTKTERCYGSSRNLVRPEADITVLESGDWNDVPEIDEGFVLIDDSLSNDEVTIEDINFTYRCQRYMLRPKTNEELLDELKLLNPYTRFNKRTDRATLIGEIKTLKGVYDNDFGAGYRSH